MPQTTWIPQTDRRACAWLLGLFAIARIAAHAAGLRFYAGSLSWYAQFLEPDLLKNRLWESLYHLHAQPPGFNLFLGLVLKIAPGHEAIVFHACYLVCGAGLALGLYGLLRHLALTPGWSLALAAVFVLSPACLLFEHYLFYTYPLTLLVVLAALACARFLQTGSRSALAGFFAAFVLLMMTRALFHLGLLVLAGGLLVLLRPAFRKRVLVGLALALLLPLGWYAKNYATFGFFGASSWLGMNLSLMIQRVPAKDRDVLRRTADLSPLAFEPPFHKPEYYQQLLPPTPPTGVPALDRTARPSGFPNANHRIYVRVGRLMLGDALRVIAAHPGTYLKTVWFEVLPIYLAPAETWDFFDDRRAPLEPYARLAPLLLLPLYVIGLLSAVGWGIRALGWLVRPVRLDARQGTLLLVSMLVLYVTAVAILVDLDENMRYRFLVDPLLLALAATTLQRLWQRARGRPAPSAPESR